ncbi:MAG: hypothetical protein ACE5I8_01380 [Thermodesulfobacteriota bacterium]
MADKEILRRYYRAKIRGIDPENFTADALISDGSVDRHGTIIEPTAWKKDIKYYKDHPVLVASHNHYDLLSQIGEAQRIKLTDEGPVVKFKYYVGEGNEQADWGWKLAEKGMAMFSVGFMAHEWEDLGAEDQEKQKKKDPTRVAWRRYNRVELAEVSQVVVGSNRNALQRMAELSGGVMKVEGTEGEKADIKSVIDFANEILKQIKDIPEEEEMVPISDEEVERPYPNHHACRLRDPGDFQKGKYVTQKRKHDGKEYSVILGRLKGEKTLTEQSYRYHRNVWTEKEARAHCKDHKGILFEPATGEGGKLYKWQCTKCSNVTETKPEKSMICPVCENEMEKVSEEEIGAEEEYRKVVPFKKEGTAPEGKVWDAGAARRRLSIWAGGPDKEKINWKKYQRGFGLVMDGEENNFGGYKFPHHDIEGGTIVTVWRGCVAGMVRLKNAPENERKGLYNHLAGHYRKNFDKEPPEFKFWTNEEIADLFGLNEDGEEDSSRNPPPEIVSSSVYDEVFTDDSGEREGDDSGLESVIEEVGKLKAKLKGERGVGDLEALVRQITRKEKVDG